MFFWVMSLFSWVTLSETGDIGQKNGDSACPKSQASHGNAGDIVQIFYSWVTGYQKLRKQVAPPKNPGDVA